MACKIIMMEIAKSGGIHVSESCLSPSLGWLSPTKISTSIDFDAPQEASYENMIKERSKDRDSMSEFEFAMSRIEHEDMHGEHMLAADELFFKGKLLPLYNPDYTDGSAVQVSRCDMRDQANRQILSNHTTVSCALYSADAENSQANVRDLIIPISPKAPKCSMMLREFFGLKKMAKSICACTASGEVATGSSCKASRSGSKKGKTVKNKPKAPLMMQANAPSALSKARNLSCASGDADCITAKARNSASEPLLKFCVAQVGCPASSVENNHQADRQQNENLEKDNTALCAACTDAVDLACIQRSNTVRDSLCCTHKDSHEQRLLGSSCSENLSDEENQCRRLTGQQSPGQSRRRSLQINLGRMSLDKSSSGMLDYEQNTCLGLPRAQSRGSASWPMRMRLGELSYEEDTGRTLTREQSRGSMRMRFGKLAPNRIAHRSPGDDGSTCRGLAGEQNRGSRGPMQVESGISSRTLSYTENTSRGSKTDQSRGGTRQPMRINIGETASPERSSNSAGNASASQARYAKNETLKSIEISRMKSLERSSSYSPKSLQRKYEQLKAIRQREGWRILERSSSYNSGMHSMRVAPVLNVPIVCMSRSKSSNHGLHTRRKA